MHFIQPPQDIVAKLLQKRKISAISGRWLSQVHTQMPERNRPLLVELWGPREQRLDQLQAAMDEVQSSKVSAR